MYGDVADTGENCVKIVAGTGKGGCGRYADGSLGGGMVREGGGRDGDGYIICWWEDNEANKNLGTKKNDPLSYAPGLEHHHLLMSTLGETGGQLEREIERYTKVRRLRN